MDHGRLLAGVNIPFRFLVFSHTRTQLKKEEEQSHQLMRSLSFRKISRVFNQCWRPLAVSNKNLPARSWHLSFSLHPKVVTTVISVVHCFSPIHHFSRSFFRSWQWAMDASKWIHCWLPIRNQSGCWILGILRGYGLFFSPGLTQRRSPARLNLMYY